MKYFPVSFVTKINISSAKGSGEDETETIFFKSDITIHFNQFLLVIIDK